jgi:hypothetical protein
MSGWNRLLPFGMLACVSVVVGKVLREEAPPQALIVAALAIVLISGLWLWLRARR